ncbi:DinB family protein [Undibacterium sp.]|uniref:DinB family protein n=1 Tax=Undibacterium sp. TaxID=1914977 RepID=UPI00374DF774
MDITLATLSAFPQQLEAHFNAVPLHLQQWAPESWDGVPSESLNALEQICHVRDIEIDGYQLRFRHLLNEEHPVLASIDTYALVAERDYAGASPADVFAAIRDARKETVHMLATLESGQWQRSGSFDGYGDVTVQGLAHFLCSHDQQHLAGLQWLMGKMAVSRT